GEDGDQRRAHPANERVCEEAQPVHVPGHGRTVACPPMPLRVAWIGILLVAIYGLLVGGAWLGIYTAQLRVVTMFVTAVLLGAWTLVAIRSPSWRPRSALWPAMVAVLASMTISTITSRVQRVSLEYLGYAVVLIAL